MSRTVIARAPGRVNLIGDHTDYNEGLALPMAIGLCVEATFIEADDARSDRLLVSTSLAPASTEHPVDLSLHTAADPDVLGSLHPPWSRLAAAVVALARPPLGGVIQVQGTLPQAAGLSSSAAFTVALASALGVRGQAPLARLCQQAEEAVGSRVGLMDPMVIAGAEKGRAMRIDFSNLATEPVPIPPELDVVIVHSGEHRELTASPYGTRRAECEAASFELGRPLGAASESDLALLTHPLLRRRARHVVSECRRVDELIAALQRNDMASAGSLMLDSHRSLSRDFEASTPAIDALVDDLSSRPGVHGARMTGGGFGGCVVALAERGALDPSTWPGRAWCVAPSPGLSVTVSGQ